VINNPVTEEILTDWRSTFTFAADCYTVQSRDTRCSLSFMQGYRMSSNRQIIAL